MTISTTKIVKIAGSALNLDDLRQLVEETAGFSAGAKLEITASRDMREGSHYSISVQDNQGEK